MGTALAKIIADNGFKVRLWNYSGDPEPLNQIATQHENIKYLPGIILPELITPQSDLTLALDGAGLVIFAVPSAVVCSLFTEVEPHLISTAVCVDVSKGITTTADHKLVGVAAECLAKWKTVVSVSGPAIAGQMARRGFTVMNIAGGDRRSVNQVKQVLENDFLKLVAVKDVKGVEICGTLKNIYAIALGILDGLKYPVNTKAALVVAALREMATLLKASGASVKTASDFAGLGDLIATGFSAESRNRRLGELLGQGVDALSAQTEIGQVVEGVTAVKLIRDLALSHQMELPIVEVVNQVLMAKLTPAEAVSRMLKNIG